MHNAYVFLCGGGDAFMIPRFKTKNGYTAYINGDICSWNIRPYTLQIEIKLALQINFVYYTSA